MKTCFKCAVEKPLTEFYKHQAMVDGHLNKCKACARSDATKHRACNDSVREYDRSRGNRLPVGYINSRRKLFPNKYKANTAVGNAIRDGKIVKPIACACGFVGKLHGHHDDYLKPLEVRWLCPRCHALWHAANGEAANP